MNYSNKQPRKNVNSVLIHALSVKPIAFNPILGKITTSAIAGLFMSQLLFWWDKGRKKGCIYKTIREFEEETCLTRSEQNRAIKIWKDLGILEVRREGIPQKRHFYLNVDKLILLLENEAKKRNIDGHYITRAN